MPCLVIKDETHDALRLRVIQEKIRTGQKHLIQTEGDFLVESGIELGITEELFFELKQASKDMGEPLHMVIPLLLSKHLRSLVERTG